MKNSMKVWIAFSLAMFANAAMAEGGPSIDVSTIVAIITGTATAALVAVNSAKLGMAGLAMAFKWIKGAIFG
ncbi:major capsid protein [Vibrio nigripulchritudo]|uniref:major capsid protein n=1 Tax=Vibrio nigripulchritudo TaxID=28173 RepID=UPI0003B22BBD|nr:major capsid protein [Vibrio nigripulchritudo]CCO41389.1 conserved exported hypothetical protein [Vibrio nigripulchritudo SFn135]